MLTLVDRAFRHLSGSGAGSSVFQLSHRIVFESGDSEPTTASTLVPTTSKFEAKGLQYKFLAFDSENPERQSEVKTWTATLTSPMPCATGKPWHPRSAGGSTR
ncbi:MAG: hypothetical protein ACK6AD_10990 [Cyanobacteriota bacterium]|jgi:hypothetical protein